MSRKTHERFDSIRDFRNEVKAGKKEVIVDGPLRKHFACDEVKVIDVKKRQIGFVISTASIDRMGDTIDPNGWELKNYKKNPVVLFGHNSKEPPIGKSISIAIDGGKLKSTAEFIDRDVSPFAYMIFQLYQGGYMRATSVGFQPLEWTFVEDNDRPFGIDFKRQELLEYSAVPVPANPEALIDAKSKGVELSPLVEWAEKVLDKWETHKGIAIPRKYVEACRAQADEKKKKIFVPDPVVQDEILRRNLAAISQKVKVQTETKTETTEEEKEAIEVLASATEEAAEAAEVEVKDPVVAEVEEKDEAETEAEVELEFNETDVELELEEVEEKDEDLDEVEAKEQEEEEQKDESEEVEKEEPAAEVVEEKLKQEVEAGPVDKTMGGLDLDVLSGVEECLADIVDYFAGGNLKEVSNRRALRSLSFIRQTLKELSQVLEIKEKAAPVVAPEIVADEKGLDDGEELLVLDLSSEGSEEKAEDADIEDVAAMVREVLAETLSADLLREEISKAINQVTGKSA